MRDRYYAKKDTKGAFDPQVGQAAQAQTALAQSAQDWNQKFYEEHVAPSLEAMTQQTTANTAQQKQLFDLDMSQAQLQDQRYRTLGIPAEDKYYQMVKDYSAPEEQERQGQAALGDVRTAAASQRAAQARSLRGLGIDPSSPAALAAQSDQAMQQAAVEAGASTRAREAAKVLGMSLTSDAANFGRGGQSGILQFGSAAGGASSAGLAGAQGSAQVAPGGAANVNTGLGLAQKAYGSNLDAYTTLNKASMDQVSAAYTGLGQAVGGAASAIPWKSDRRLKKHTKKIATLAHDIGVWMFRYIWEPNDAPLRRGFMADEVEPVFPDAVTTGPGGYKLIDYSKVLV